MAFSPWRMFVFERASRLHTADAGECYAAAAAQGRAAGFVNFMAASRMTRRKSVGRNKRSALRRSLSNALAEKSCHWAAAPVQQIGCEEPASTGHESAAIIRRGPMMTPVRRNALRLLRPTGSVIVAISCRRHA